MAPAADGADRLADAVDGPGPDFAAHGDVLRGVKGCRKGRPAARPAAGVERRAARQRLASDSYIAL